MGRDAYVFLEHGLVVFWSRKAGNTSLAQWLAADLFGPALGAGQLDTSAFTDLDEEPAGAGLPLKARPLLRTAQYHLRGEQAARLAMAMGWRTFILARDPYTRAASAFVNKFVIDGRKPLRRFEELPRFAQRLVVEIARRDDPAVDADAVARGYRGISFLQFLEHIAHVIDKRPGRKEPRLNDHWAPQVPFSLAEFDAGQVVHLERIATELRPLADALGIAAPFPRARRTDDLRPAPPRGLDLSTVPSLELATGPTSVPHANLGSARARELVAQAYALDYRKLGYPLGAAPAPGLT